MLDDHYTSCDLLKFYYNVKVEYNLKARSYKIPIVFFITAICCILIINALLIFKKDFIYII
jgi:hypothetical protein